MAVRSLYFCASGTLRKVLALDLGSREIGRAAAAPPGGQGRPAMDLLNALLDLADAVSAGVALAAFWHTWVVPSARRRLPPGCASRPEELERFIRAAALIRPSSHRLT